MHKNAGDLKVHDCFLMAGGAYEIERIYVVDDEDYIRLRFHPIMGSGGTGSILILKSTLFTTL